MSRVVFKLDDIKNTELRRRVESKLLDVPSFRHGCVQDRSGGPGRSPVAGNGSDATGAILGAIQRKRKNQASGPNKTEERFNRDMLAGRGVYEGLTFRLPGGSRYTPDWIYESNGQLFAVEVKGPHRFPSEGRALTAFLEARAAWRSVVFAWFRWTGSEWREQHCEAIPSRRTATALNSNRRTRNENHTRTHQK